MIRTAVVTNEKYIHACEIVFFSSFFSPSDTALKGIE
jgi:hypothetical protein